ncbi:unnamed protein product [Euphydryas editha]|uniref:Uncharacterized protein n=1 Tax=Euphydryas editha TaxID=104508 RepID=A0AAU9U5A5_EUPED|nr:unnamed protein product [Euphydryas editha]
MAHYFAATFLLTVFVAQCICGIDVKLLINSTHKIWMPPPPDQCILPPTRNGLQCFIWIAVGENPNQ